MTSIYEQHDAAFSQVSASVILDKDKNLVAKIAFKFPKDGAGRLYAYVHWLGTEMVRGHANGYGYDKKSAAVESAISKMKSRKLDESREWVGSEESYKAFLSTLDYCDGDYWNTKLDRVGFTVLQAV